RVLTCGPDAPGLSWWPGGDCSHHQRCERSHFPAVRAGRDRISCQDTRVSTIWTPLGEHQPEPDPQAGEGLPPEAEAVEMSPEQYQEMMQARAELRAVPVADIIANHAVGLHQLALIHLLPDPGTEGTPEGPRLAEAGLAIDALGALVDT